MAENGKLSESELAPIPGGELTIAAAAAWNAHNGPAVNNLRPTGSRSSYRTYQEQVEFWNAYLAGGNLAARPGTSNHGWGVAIDLAEEWMRSWIDDHGAKFGWKKTEAFSEWWHVNFVGGVHFPTFNTLKQGSKGKRVKWYTKRLAYIHPKGAKWGYIPRWYWKYTHIVKLSVIDFQADQGLVPDGVIGEKTAHRISEVFHRQYVSRNGKRKRNLKDKVLRRQ